MSQNLCSPAYKLIKAWLDARSASKITVKKGDVVIEIQGLMSVKKIKSILEDFRKVSRVKDKKEVKVIIPKDCDPNLSEELLLKANQKKLTD